MRTAFTVLLLTCAGLLVRMWTADWGGLSSDEANGIAIAVTGSWSDLVQHLREDGNPPLFYVVVRLFTLVTGHHDLALRLLSLGFSTAMIPLSYVIARKLFGKSVALSTALLVVFSPPLIRWGNMARMYSMLPSLSMASCWFLIALLRSPGSWLNRIGLSLSSALMIYCHHWGFFVILGQVAMLIWGLVRRWWSFRTTLPIFLSLASAGLAYLPWAPVLAYTLRHDESPWAYPPALTNLLMYGPADMFIGGLNSRDGQSQLSQIYAGLWAFFLLFAWSNKELQGNGQGKDEAAASTRAASTAVRSISSAIVFGLLGALLVSTIKPAWRDRYLVAFAPMVLMLFSVSLKPFLKSLNPKLAVFVPLILWLPCWIPMLHWLHQVPESSAWNIADAIARNASPKRDLVVVSWEAAAPAITRALPSDIDLVSFPDLDRVMIVKWDGLNKRIRSDRRMIELIDRIEKTLNQGGTVWLVDDAQPTRLAPKPGSIPVSTLGFLRMEHLRMEQVRTWLTANAKLKQRFLWGPGREISLFLSQWQASGKSPAWPKSSLPTNAVEAKPGAGARP